MYQLANRAVRAPAFAEGEEFLGLGHTPLAVGDGPALPDAEVVDGQHVGPAEAEDQKHFDGPNTDAPHGDEPLDELFVGHLVSLIERGDDTRQGFAGEVLHRENLGTREPSLAEH